MTVAEKLKIYRASNGYSVAKMAEVCEVSPTLIRMLENGMVTHPIIARRIGNIAGLDEKDIYLLMPEIHRPDSPNYDPDKFKQPEQHYMERIIVKKSKKEKLIDAYVSDRRRKRYDDCYAY